MTARLVDISTTRGVAGVRRCAGGRGRLRRDRRVVSGRARARGGHVKGIGGSHRQSVHHRGAGGRRCLDGARAKMVRPGVALSRRPQQASVSNGRATGTRSPPSPRCSNEGSAFHPIYGLGGGASQALQSLKDRPLDAIVMLGTGMDAAADRRGHWLERRAGDVMRLCLAWRGSRRWTAEAEPDFARALARRRGLGGTALNERL